MLPFCFHIVYRYARRKLNPFFEKNEPLICHSIAKVNAAPESICYSSQIYKKCRFYAVYNHNIHACLQNYQAQLQKEQKPIQPEKYLFPHSNKNEPISRVQAFRIIKKVAAYYNIPGVICCHSLRKTFGYHAWRQGVQPAMLVSIYNHSSYEVTKRYLGIEQDDRDKIFQEIIL